MAENATRAIANNAAVQGVVQQVVADSLQRRAHNTRRSYEPKKQEWLGWCATRAFVDGSIVTEGKLLLFLEEVRAWKAERAKRKREKFDDRGKGTVQDTYSIDQLKNVAEYFMAQKSERRLRDRVDLLFGHALMARGETTRKLQLPDLFSMELPNEGPTTCVTALAVMDQGKMNQFGRIEYGGCIRHRDVMLIHGKIKGREISYSAQASGLKKALKAYGVNSKKVTQIRRTSSCIIAEAMGASEASI
uniref:Ndc10 domain-containing protein n=1 Tax=Phytophthora ramorum TaxID=164328 RepID=H3H2M0_PHYRM